MIVPPSAIAAATRASWSGVSRDVELADRRVGDEVAVRRRSLAAAGGKLRRRDVAGRSSGGTWFSPKEWASSTRLRAPSVEADLGVGGVAGRPRGRHARLPPQTSLPKLWSTDVVSVPRDLVIAISGHTLSGHRGLVVEDRRGGDDLERRPGLRRTLRGDDSKSGDVPTRRVERLQPAWTVAAFGGGELVRVVARLGVHGEQVPRSAGRSRPRRLAR